MLFITEVALVLVFGVDYRFVEAPYIGPSLHLGFIDLPLRMLVPCVVSLLMIGALQLFLSRTFIGRAIQAVSQDPLALRLMAADPEPDQAHRLRHLDRHRLGRRRAPDHHPAGRALDRPRIYRPRLRDLRAGRHGQPRPAPWSPRMLLGVVESLTATFYGPSWAPAVAFGFLLLTLAVRPAGLFGRQLMRNALVLSLLALLVARRHCSPSRALVGNDYVFFAGYIVLQYIVLATAWNILGGYTGYVNFGTAAFFALGAYCTVGAAQDRLPLHAAARR